MSEPTPHEPAGYASHRASPETWSPAETRSRINEAFQAVVSFEGDNTVGLMLHLMSILDSPTPSSNSADGTGLGRLLTAGRVRQRLAAELIATWPRMALGDHAQDVADTVMAMVLPVIGRLRWEAIGWRVRSDEAVQQLDRARSLAVTLEQTNAEGIRLLKAGQSRLALLTLEGDGQPVGASCVVEPATDDAAQIGPAAHEAACDGSDGSARGGGFGDRG
ncbi:hypothetical protein OK074_2089 [Actinobacteria bacterium OK074]|nr:hypothetical protein OK074_2089 [Actinobacteria bacterium OK074]